MMMGGMGVIPTIPTVAVSIGWFLCGRQVIKAQAEMIQMQMEMGYNPGHCSFAPFK